MYKEKSYSAKKCWDAVESNGGGKGGTSLIKRVSDLVISCLPMTIKEAKWIYNEENASRALRKPRGG